MACPGESADAINENLLKYYEIAKNQNDVLRLEWKKIEAQNGELSKKIQNQAAQLAALQNSGKERNEEMKRKDGQIQELLNEISRLRNVPPPVNNNQQLLDNLQTDRLENLKVISNLRVKVGMLENELKTKEHQRYLEMGRMRKMHDDMEAERQKRVQMQRIFETEKEKMRNDYKKEVECLERALKSSNEQAKCLNEELHKRVKESALTRVIDDLENRNQAKENYIEYLKEKKDEDENKVRELTRDFTRKDMELKKVNEQNTALQQELDLLRGGNRRDLEDKTCLICKSDMYQNPRQFEQLPKCTGCKRRYHGECISEWFQQKIECPVCRKDGRDMENTDRLINLSEGLQGVRL